jgi:ubiquitin-activating enzyme E1
MGVATEGHGQVWVTDPDLIERSNLNRQFLFRNTDIGKMKSDAAAAAVVKINPELRIVPHSNRLGPETEDIYHDEFYQALSGVCNALDNVPARLYSDAQCVRYCVPLLESGTRGAVAHMQIIIPELTDSYASRQDAPERGIPMCTLHHFPSSITHTCMWARDRFGGLFENDPATVNTFVDGAVNIDTMLRDDINTLGGILHAVESFFITETVTNAEDCARWARLKFEEFFNHSIRDLQAQFPEDHIGEDHQPFWGGARRFPSPCEYDPSDPLHVAFVQAAAVLRARVFGISIEKPESIAEMAGNVLVPEWVASEVRLEQGEPNADIHAIIDDQIERLRGFIGCGRRFVPEVFEKDNDENSHIDFIAATANIRAANYSIEQADALEIKKIAGHIIPAIATTTAMICGFVALEMYKVHAIEPKGLEDFRSATVNLASNIFSMCEASPCREFVCPANGWRYTMWTKWIIDGDLTIREFVAALRDKYRLNAVMITADAAIINSVYDPKPENWGRKITEILVTDRHRAPLDAGQNLLKLDTACADLDGNEVQTPPIFLKIH